MSVASQIRSSLDATRWREDNEALLRLEIDRVRLLCRQRLAMLRREWPHDPLVAHQAGVVSAVEAEWLAADGGSAAAAGGGDLLPSRVAEIERRIADQAAAMRSRQAPAALDMICDGFGLEAIERHALMVAVAVAVEPGLSRLYGYLQNDLSLCYPTPRLAVDLVDPEAPFSAMAAFAPGSALRSGGLVELGERRTGTGGALRALEVPGRVVEFLRGIDVADPEFELLATPCAEPALSPALAARADSLARALRLEAESGRPPRLVLLGRSGAGRETLATAIARALGRQARRLHPARLVREAAGRELAAGRLVRESKLASAAYLVAVGERAESDLAWLLSVPVPLLFVAERPPAWHGVAVEVVARPDATEQRAIWRSVLGPGVADVDQLATALAERFDLGPAAIGRIGDSARAKARLRTGEARALPTHDEIRRACRESAGVDGLTLGKLVDPKVTWDDLVLPPEVTRQLREIVAQVRHRVRVYETWRFGERSSRGRGITALFAGPSGTGKTLAAEILANDLGVPLFRVDLSSIVSKYVGETEKHLRRVFDACEESGVALYFDECEALFGRRVELRDAHDRYANIEIDYLLQRVEDYRGLVLLGTNRKSDLDGAFLRRLRFLVDFPFPESEARARIWRLMFPPEAPQEELDWQALATLELSGGSIRNVALNAAFRAAVSDSSITMEHLRAAVEGECRKLGHALPRGKLGERRRPRGRGRRGR